MHELFLPLMSQEDWVIDEALIHLVGLLGPQAPLKCFYQDSDILIIGSDKQPFSRSCTNMTLMLSKICILY